MTRIQFSKMVQRLCACGREIGMLQYEVERRLREFPDQTLETTGERVASILNDMGILKMCCRSCFLAAPKYMFVNADIGTFTIQQSSRNEAREPPPETPKATHLPFPELPAV